MVDTKNKLISVIVPTFNESGNVDKLIGEVSDVLRDNFEILFVNDGSSDDSLDRIRKLSARDNRIKFISFSRNFGHQAALRAGLAYAQGEAVISMDADLQHPPQLLPKLIAKWHEGYEVVYTIRKDTSDTGFMKRLTSRWFYKIMNFLSGLQMEEGAADFRLLDRKVVDVINSQKESDIFLRGYISWIGFKQIGIPYVPAKRFSGESKYTFKKMIGFASHGVTQFSIKPLRLAHVLATAAFVLSFVYIIYAIIVSATGSAIPGWLSLVVLFVFLQGVQFMLLGMIGEYLGRTFMQTKFRPEYIVSEANCEKPHP
jgi:dolichol-phosphate mannosyltransferase